MMMVVVIMKTTSSKKTVQTFHQDLDAGRRVYSTGMNLPEGIFHKLLVETAVMHTYPEPAMDTCNAFSQGKFCKPSRDCQTSQELQQRTRMQHVKYP
ncbi:hypothetical protein GWK47_022533 [Chionoecetes opilio]|uniref:Uncharacterized protein n=1 Tax=Chionoecetes opilio TaxID=41210 RepID=A0A8J4XS83_CHIOP|nr:hypothetical protein GWK47_022533 [Chionoecetes opilio]